ncbi:CheR family methyltransferase [Pandoraea terrae]
MQTGRTTERGASADEHARAAALSGERDFTFTLADFGRIRTLIYQRAGIALAEHKREMVYSRIARRLRALGITSFTEYLDRLEADTGDGEWESFTNALTTNLTSFFRESHHFPLLAEFVRTRSKPVSVWCCAASTGEEPYSIAMTLSDAIGQRPNASVLATDVDTQVLARGAAGVYTGEQTGKLTPEQLRKHFFRGTGANAGKIKIRPEVRSLVTFEPLNLLAPSWQIGGPFDVIFCRNVMIYFDKGTQARILERFVPLLKPGGLLFAGHSENFTYVSRAFRLRGQTVYELAGAGRQEG